MKLRSDYTFLLAEDIIGPHHIYDCNNNGAYTHNRIYCATIQFEDCNKHYEVVH